jgi:hypothetical protein
VFGLTLGQKVLLIYVFCLKSESGKDEFDLSSELASAILGKKPKEIEEDIQQLIASGFLTRNYSQPTANQLPTNGSPTDRQTDRQTDKQIGQNEFDHESLYLLYPRRVKKKDGLRKLRTLIKTNEDFDSIKKAITNYTEYCSKNVSETKYVLHFDKFLRSWEDWLEPKSETKLIKKTDMSEILGEDAH